MKSLIFSMVTLGVAACGTPMGPIAPTDLSEAEERTARKYVHEQMKDPTSVIWGPIRAASVNGIKVVCVYLNGKNSYGAYVGMSPQIISISNGYAQPLPMKYMEYSVHPTIEEDVPWTCHKFGL